MTFTSVFLASAIFAVIAFFLCFLACQALEPCFGVCQSVCCSSSSSNWPETPVYYRRCKKKDKQLQTEITNEPIFIHFLSFAEHVDFDDPSTNMTGRQYHEFDNRVYQRYISEAVHEINLGLDTCVFITPEMAMSATVRGESFRLELMFIFCFVLFSCCICCIL